MYHVYQRDPCHFNDNVRKRGDVTPPPTEAVCQNIIVIEASLVLRKKNKKYVCTQRRALVNNCSISSKALGYNTASIQTRTSNRDSSKCSCEVPVKDDSYG